MTCHSSIELQIFLNAAVISYFGLWFCVLGMHVLGWHTMYVCVCMRGGWLDANVINVLKKKLTKAIMIIRFKNAPDR